MKKSQAPILDGKKEAEKIIKALKHKNIKAKGKVSLAVILVGNDKASKLYVSLKEKKAAEIGVGFKKFLLPAKVSEKKIIDLIQKLNRDKKVSGIMIQLPLPKKFNTNRIIKIINPVKDVDGLQFKTQNSINKTQGKNVIIPPTTQSILHLIKLSRQKLANKKAIILANSTEFSTPLKFLLKKQLKLKKVDVLLKTNYQIIKLSDYQIIISVFGKKWFLKPNMIKKDAIIIDVGITRKNARTFGDVHPDCFKKSKYISPVPGGVGPLTVAYLFKNLILLSGLPAPSARFDARRAGG